MSFNENHNISLQNYEEWFILYMDNELNADQKKMVDDFLLVHPHLGEELELLLSTKLPADAVPFSGKEELMAASMKLNTVDESLLLYIDNELPAAEKTAVEKKISLDKDLRLQYDLLQKTKLDAADIIPYPDKKELYRHTERRILFPVWMRIAAAVLMLFTGSYFFLVEAGGDTPDALPVAEVKNPAKQPTTTPVITQKDEAISTAEEPALAVVSTQEKAEAKPTPAVAAPKAVAKTDLAADNEIDAVAVQKIDLIKVDLTTLTDEPVTALNKNLTHPTVTSVTPDTYNSTEALEESIVTDGDDKPKRTPAKGFLRKVSRFIERRTGIGTANADNEILVGAVALKLN